MTKIIFALLFFFSVLSIAQVPQDSLSTAPSARSSVDTTDYSIGDYITYKVIIDHPKDVLIFFPDLKDTIAPVEIVKQDTVRQSEINGVTRSLYFFTLALYDSADVSLPSYRVPYRAPKDTAYGYVTVPPAYFTVHSFAVDTTKEIRNIKEPIAISPPFPWEWVILGAGVILTAVIIYLLLKRRKTKPAVERAQPVIPYYTQALQQLDALEKLALWQNGNVKEYHSQITGIVRGYFEERFMIPALENPSSDILRVLEPIPDASGIFTVCKEFLTDADLVKFAKYEPQPEVNIRMMDYARKIITQTIPQPSSAGNTGDPEVHS